MSCPGSICFSVFYLCFSYYFPQGQSSENEEFSGKITRPLKAFPHGVTVYWKEEREILGIRRRYLGGKDKKNWFEGKLIATFSFSLLTHRVLDLTLSNR